MATWETTWSGVWFLQLWPPAVCLIRANGDKEGGRTKGLWLSWGWKGGGDPFSKHNILWPDLEEEGGHCRALLGAVRAPEFLFLKVDLGSGV